MAILYNIFVSGYQLAVRLAALRNSKAKEWIEGRKNLFSQLEEHIAGKSNVIWVHSASTGEFEQAKPVIEALKKSYPGHLVVATFFSPSGFRAAKNYAAIDYRYYLPADTKANANRFVQLVHPKLVIFSKYDFWHHHLKAIQQAGTPLLLISAIFRPRQVFFKWYGGFHRAMLQRFSHLFVQDQTSIELLEQAGITHCSISGDTRFDRVAEIARNLDLQTEENLAPIRKFIGNQPCIVAGSTWAGDEQLLAKVQAAFPGTRWLIVPHELGKSHLEEMDTTFPRSVRYSEWIKDQQPVATYAPAPPANNVMIVDAMGLLSRLYALATITYVGGGFTRDGIHNTLEAAVWGKPVIIGPNYEKYREAKELIAAGGAFSVSDAAALQSLLHTLLQQKAALAAASESASDYVRQNCGATAHILHYIQEKRLLTR